MSTQSPPSVSSPPRIILELQPDGTIIAEAYINGSRQRTPLERNLESWHIRDLMAAIVADRKRQAERIAAKKAAEDLTRHRRVWTGVAQDYGVGFANKTVGPRNNMSGPVKPPLAPADISELI